HVHHQAAVAFRPDVPLQHPSPDRAAHPSAAWAGPTVATGESRLLTSNGLSPQVRSSSSVAVWPRMISHRGFSGGQSVLTELLKAFASRAWRGGVTGVHLARYDVTEATTVHVDDLDISPSKIGETAQRI